MDRNKIKSPVALSFAIMTSLLVLFGLSSCGGYKSPIGKANQVNDPQFRSYISLAPSNTEIIYLLKGDQELLGDCTQCDYPADATKKPKVGSFTSTDLEKISMLHPDGAFLVNGQEAMAETLKKHGIPSVILNNNSVHDISENIHRVGRIIHRSAMATTAYSEFNKHVQLITQAVSKSTTHPKVFFCVWPEPLTTAGSGSYLSDAITICGGTNIAANLPGAYPQFNAERLLAEQPDVIILPHEADNADFLQHAPWTSLKAVQEKRYYFLPKKEDDRLSRPSIRLTAGLLWLTSRIHPEIELP